MSAAGPHSGGRARDAATGTVVAERLRSAHTHWTRFKGLLGTKELAAGEGLWLRPCNQVHMIGMRYAIDVVFLDDEHRIVETVTALQPGRFSPRVSAASSVLELPTGTVRSAGLTMGRRIAIEGDVAAAAPSSVRIASMACNLVLAALYLFFTAAHVSFARRTGQWATSMPLVAQESLLVVLFLTRRQSIGTSTRPLDWVVGIAGVLLPLFMRPVDPASAASAIGQLLQIVGLSIAVFAIAILGRSIGIVAANRGVKTAGLYRFVRHPMYAAYLVSYFGYVVAYPSLRNCVLVTGTVLALNARAIVEERFLARDGRYREYLAQTRWRFVPYVY